MARLPVVIGPSSWNSDVRGAQRVGALLDIIGRRLHAPTLVSVVPLILLVCAQPRAGVAFPQDDIWVGRRFMPREECRPMVGDQQFPQKLLGLPYVVRRVTGDRLWIGRASVGMSEVVPFEQAVAYYSEFIAAHPDSSWAYNYRGVVRAEQGELDRALRDFTEAIRLNAQLAGTYVNRGRVWFYKQELDKALRDFAEAIRLDPRNPTAFNSRALVWKHKSEFEKALADYAEAVRVDPDAPEGYNGQAWLWATAREAKHRDGKRAVESALKACRLSDYRDENHLDTLAAAYAEAGTFDEAVKWQTQAANLAPNERKAEFRSRIDLYRRRQPFRE